jgi:hypothetical protein
MKFLASESTVETGNGQVKVKVLPQNFHILSYANDNFLLSKVSEIEEIVTDETSEIIKIDEFDISFSSNYPIVVKDEEDNIILAAVKPEDENVVTFDVKIHRIFDGETWKKIDNYQTYSYSGYGYRLVVEDDYFFLNTVLLSSK